MNRLSWAGSGQEASQQLCCPEEDRPLCTQNLTQPLSLHTIFVGQFSGRSAGFPTDSSALFGPSAQRLRYCSLSRWPAAAPLPPFRRRPVRRRALSPAAGRPPSPSGADRSAFTAPPPP